MTQQGGELDVVAEYADCELGDERRTRRLVKMAGDLNREPAASFPLACGDDAALEGTYRFLNNRAVTAEGILGGHACRTVERASAYDWVVAIHDTSHFEFPGEAPRKGLAPLRGKGQGFWGHFTLLVGGDDRHPLGVVALQTRSRSKTSRKKLTPTERRNDPNNESRRWYEGVEQAEAQVAGATRIVHVMDREGDSYELLAQLCVSHSPFVIRGYHNRRLDEEPYERLFEALDDTETIVERLVPLSRRSDYGRVPNATKIHPARQERLARLAIRATRVTLKRSHRAIAGMPPTIDVNVVHVREVETNGNHEPVEWILHTSEPVDSADDVERIVDIYRMRWLIEEYFKALKTGCAINKRQLESKHALVNALAVFIPIAWRLLRLRALAREDSSAPATAALTTTQVEVLVATSNMDLPRAPTIQQALMAVASLGGHIRNNGEPGWLVLGRGYDRLLTMETAWAAARRSDQS
jgi:hypothetical protein